MTSGADERSPDSPHDPAAGGTPASHRTTVRRGAHNAEYFRAAILDILRAGMMAHVGVNTAEGPLVLPMAYGLTDDTLYIHGALANALLKAGADKEICVTVTVLDGLVMAKCAFNYTMNYRSVVVRGAGRVVTDADEHLAALRIVTDHIVPTWDVVRPVTPQELRATRVVALSLDECSAKVRTGHPTNEESDADAAFWCGELPMVTRFGEPVTAPDAAGEVPAQVAALAGRDAHNRNG